MSQAALATAANVSDHLLRKWERGLELPDSEALERIAAALKTNPSLLLSAQQSLLGKTTPGEGYTTAKPGTGGITLARKPVPNDLPRVMDLFCGSGGLSFGFEQTGRFVTTCGIDLLPDRIATFQANHDHALGICGDLRLIPFETLELLVGWTDIIVGGPPCQGFSSIRPFRTLTEGDPRNSLVEHYVLTIARLRPRWFVFENVVGILTHENGERLDAVVEGLRAAGYSVDWRVLNAAHYGIPQYRERIVIVGNCEGLDFHWPMPTNTFEYRSMAGGRQEVVRTDPLFSWELPPPVTVQEAIGDLPLVGAGEEVHKYGASNHLTPYQKMMREGSDKLTLHRATRHGARMMDIIRHSGANISALPKGMVSSGFSSCYSRLEADKPSTTLTVNFVHPASNRCIHPTQDRALTPREGARLQSFPDRFQFAGTSAQIVKQIGNAVPPLLGKAIAQAILNSEDKSYLEDYRLAN